MWSLTHIGELWLNDLQSPFVEYVNPSFQYITHCNRLSLHYLHRQQWKQWLCSHRSIYHTLTGRATVSDSAPISEIPNLSNLSWSSLGSFLCTWEHDVTLANRHSFKSSFGSPRRRQSPLFSHFLWQQSYCGRCQFPAFLEIRVAGSQAGRSDLIGIMYEMSQSRRQGVLTLSCASFDRDQCT